MTDIKDILEKLADRKDLTPEEAQKALESIIEGEVGVEQTTAFLIAMRAKGETIQELTTFVRVMRDAAISPDVDVTGAVDLCGTGGDGSGTFNISTASMFVVAGAGIPVLKHGNRSISSKSGSADVLEALDIVATLHKKQIEKVFDETGMAFMFAPQFHPAMKHVMPARQVLGIRSFFNTMGPLLNPAGVKRQVVGAFDKRTSRQIAEILANLDTEHVFSVHGRDGLDEFSLSAPTFLYELKGDKVTEHPPFDPATLGFGPVSLQQLQGGDAFFNADIIRSIMQGKATEAQRNIVLLNATFGIHVSGKSDSLEQAKEMAVESVDSGAAMKALEKMSEATNDVMEISN
ncbi:MAG: anthranilate phosphoribosyltransferase [Balneolaceae bacterium]|nr:anthranilate phosphoribosyltransferase [Balneolaceae bacterium]